MEEPTLAEIDRMAAAWYGPIFNPNDTGIVTAQQRKHAREALLRGVQPPEPQPSYEVERYTDGWAVRRKGHPPIARLWTDQIDVHDTCPDAEATARIIRDAANGTGPAPAELAAHRERAGVYMFTGTWEAYTEPGQPGEATMVGFHIVGPHALHVVGAQWAAHKGKPMAVFLSWPEPS